MKAKVLWMVFGAIIYFVVSSFIQMLNSKAVERPKTINTIINMEELQAEIESYKRVCGFYPNNLNELKKPNNCSYKGSVLPERKYSDYMGEIFTYSVSGAGYIIKSSPLSWIEGSSTDKAFHRTLDPK